MSMGKGFNFSCMVGRKKAWLLLVVRSLQQSFSTDQEVSKKILSREERATVAGLACAGCCPADSLV